MQECDFPWEIIVGDDGSNDGSQDIARFFQKRAPERVRLLMSKRNLRPELPSGRLNLGRSFRAVRGDYVALLEGDDYWTNAFKLATQVRYLDSTPTAAGCFHDSVCVDSDGQPTQGPFRTAYDAAYTQEQCLTDLRSAYATCSLMFRSDIVKQPLPSYYQRAGSDFLLDLAITERGTLDHIPMQGGVYRIHPGGVWSRLTNPDRILHVLKRMSALQGDKLMKKRYGVYVEARRKVLFSQLLLSCSEYADPWKRRLEYVAGNESGVPLWRRLRIAIPTAIWHFPSLLRKSQGGCGPKDRLICVLFNVADATRFEENPARRNDRS
jgi:glycosyltransferase involved in cell wall biosynthesis